MSDLSNSSPVPLNKVPDINVIHTLDFMSYQYALEPELYKALISKGTVFSQVVSMQGIHVGFALWERGSIKKPAFIHRLGVLPRIIIAQKTTHIRQKGIGTKILQRVIDDIKRNKKPESNMMLQMVLSENVCLGPKDPDDVTEFMKKKEFIWTKSYPEAFFEYGKKAEGLVFERDLS